MDKILTFIKTRTVAFWLLSVSFVLTLVGLIVAIVSCSAPNGAYVIADQGTMIALSIIALVVIVGTLVVSAWRGDRVWVGILPLVAVILIGFSIFILFVGKIDLMGTIWFSELDQGNKVAESALNVGVVGIIMYLLAGISLGVGCCFKLSKKKD